MYAFAELSDRKTKLDGGIQRSSTCCFNSSSTTILFPPPRHNFLLQTTACTDHPRLPDFHSTPSLPLLLIAIGHCPPTPSRPNPHNHLPHNLPHVTLQISLIIPFAPLIHSPLFGWSPSSATSSRAKNIASNNNILPQQTLSLKLTIALLNSLAFNIHISTGV